MPDRRGLTLLEDLPQEIIDKILIRLPSKDVGRCRAISTSWRSATSTPEFMLEHHRRQPSLPIIDGKGRPASHVVFRDTGAGASNQPLWPFLPGINSAGNFLHCAYGGFLIVSRRYQFYIYNPVIRKHALIPQPQFGQGLNNTIIGFYWHHPTGEYRVLWVLKPQHSSKFSSYVLTIGSDKPRHVPVTMPAVSSPSMEHKLLQQLSYSFYYPPPVHHHGSLHWCPDERYIGSDIAGGDGNIIVFDTEAESFRWMRSPTQPCTSKNLFNMNGTLAFWGCSIPAVMNVWVMQDYETEIWALKYRIDLSMVEASRQLYLTSLKKKEKTPLNLQCFTDMVVLNDRELLIKFNEKHVLHCDIDGKFLGMVKLGKSQYRMSLTQHRLQESIIPIPSHKMQTEDEEPPCSTRQV